MVDGGTLGGGTGAADAVPALRELLADREWHEAAELRELLGDGWAGVLEEYRRDAIVQVKRDGRRSTGKDRYSYRFCWEGPA